MKTCPACNRTYADEQKFCPTDGTPLAAGTAQTGGTPPSQSNPWTPPGGNAPPPGAASPPSWQTPAPARKRKIWPWVLGIVAVVGLGLVALLGIGGYALYKYGDQNVNTSANSNMGADTPADSADDVDISGTEKYVNTRSDKSGNLATHYVDFSFRYPDTWKLDPSPEPSFVRVERANDDGGTIENFSVGWFSANGPVNGNKQLLSQVVNNLSGQIAGNFPGYEKVSEGFTKFGGYDGYELRFGRSAGGGGAKAIPYWGRVVVLPDPKGGKDGVSIIMLATGNSDEIEGASDLGLKGELPVIVKTFRLGVSK
ncbi:MAG: hypothetical protein LC802_15260 [Acidobacteria bacterium]|nr:hypothetical protein [Acidobacteriota bacterium]